jgi:hypothetical protein
MGKYLGLDPEEDSDLFKSWIRIQNNYRNFRSTTLKEKEPFLSYP